VPRDVLVRKFGDSLKQEALGRIIEKSVEETFKEESFPKEDRPLPYSQPQIQDELDLKLDFEKDLQFSLVYDVLPKATVGKWEGFEIEIPDVSVTEDDISRELENVRERNAVVLDKDDEETAAKNDVVTVNYCELDENGEAIAGTEREGFVFTLGSGPTYYKFEDEIFGMKKGETKDFEKTYPEDFENTELAGKTKKLRVTATALKLKRLPDLDDELAQDVDEKFNTLDDLKNSIRDRLAKNLDQRLKDIKNNKILECIMETAPTVIPESMIRLELDSRWRNMARRFNMDSEGLYNLMEKDGRSSQALLDEWRPVAVKALHSRLIVETLMQDLKLEASDEEADNEIKSIASRTGETEDDIREYYSKDEAMEFLKEEVKERKLFDMLFEKNTIKQGKLTSYVDFMSNNG
jgi:trigger factor